MPVAHRQPCPRRPEELRVDGCRKSADRTDPQIGRVADALIFQLGGSAVENVVADVFLIGQHLLNRARRPPPPQIRSLLRTAAISLWCLPSCTNIRNIRRTVSTSSTGPGSSTTRSLCKLFCSPKARMALGLPC